MIKKHLNWLIGLFMLVNGFCHILFAIFSLNHSVFANSTLYKYANFLHYEQIVRISAFSTILFGIFLMSVGVGLIRYQRHAWVYANIVLFILLISNIYPSIQFELFIFCVINIFLLWITREYYTHVKHRLTYQQAMAYSLLFFPFVYGILGTYILRREFNGVHSMLDAVYYTIVTYSTVGYGDVVPQTQNARLFVVSMIIFGLGAFATVVTILVIPFVEKRIKGVFTIMKTVSKHEQHILIYGFNDISKAIAKHYEENASVVFIEMDSLISQVIEKAGFAVIAGEFSDPKIMKLCNIKNAKCLLFLHENDADNILNVMSVAMYKKEKNLIQPKLIVRINNPININKAKEAGADEVFSPTLLSQQYVETVI